jgi:hypothetical protein
MSVARIARRVAEPPAARSSSAEFISVRRKELGRAVKSLENWRDRFEKSAGDEKAIALLSAVCFCIVGDLPIPDWAGYAFLEAIAKWQTLEVGSLDEAFGSRPKSPTRRRRLLLAGQVKRNVAAINSRPRALKLPKGSTGPQWMFQRNRGIDWETLAKELGSSKTTLQDLYYMRKRKASRKRVKNAG